MHLARTIPGLHEQIRFDRRAHRPSSREIARAGEGSQGPAVGAIVNAFADATGKRIRELPLTPERVKAALG
jgi:hypothetical protein